MDFAKGVDQEEEERGEIKKERKKERDKKDKLLFSE